MMNTTRPLDKMLNRGRCENCGHAREYHHNDEDGYLKCDFVSCNCNEYRG